MYIYIYQKLIIITNIIIVGNYDKAEKLYSKLLNRYRKKVGDSHPDTYEIALTVSKPQVV